MAQVRCTDLLAGSVAADQQAGAHQVPSNGPTRVAVLTILVA
jgi:hypothetical protein